MKPRGIHRSIILVLFMHAACNQLYAATLENERAVQVNNEFARVAHLYLKNAMKPHVLWSHLARLYQDQNLTEDNRILLLQLQADLLYRADLPVIGATYASDALKLTNKPLSDQFKRAWRILANVSKSRPIQYMIEDLAYTLDLKDKYPFYFGNDWNYIMGGALAERGYDEQAIQYFNLVSASSRYFMPARYQLGMLLYEKGNTKAAMASLKSILMPTTREISPLRARDKAEMWNYANMALGRIEYEQRHFLDSARYFRRVYKESTIFYDALFEQSWSLFMSGNPKHALGSLYGVSSSFFSDENNPEAKLLEAIVYFWMCRYSDSRNSLADFAENYAKTMNSLSALVDGQRLSPPEAYDLFENLVSGVSSDSLGIPREVLMTASRRDPMLLVRDQLATVMTESDRLQKKGVFGNKSDISGPLARIAQIRQALKIRLGERFIEEIELERKHYGELYSQAEFLYLELLMSEKEQILGRELHAEMKVDQVSDFENIRGWGRNTQHWTGEKKGEYWWDEIGFHLVDVEPKCVE